MNSQNSSGSNENGWVIVKRGNKRAFNPTRSRKESSNNSNRNSKSAQRRITRRKLLEKFFEEDDVPDELYMAGQVAVEKKKEPKKEPQLLGEKEKEKVQKALVDFFREGYIQNVLGGGNASDKTILDYINSILVKYDIKISGGFILKNMGMFEGNTGSSSIDIDIYLPPNPESHPMRKKKRTMEIHKALQDLFNVDKVNGKPKYKYFKVSGTFSSKKQAFFQKNGIYSVTKYSRGENAEMDLVQADITTTPIRIIQRFDLTFCQNWYDGENLWSMDKEAVYKRAPGRLEDSYVPIYLDGNPVTRKRIAKYMKRGFRVHYKDPKTGEMVEITEENVKNKTNA